MQVFWAGQVGMRGRRKETEKKREGERGELSKYLKKIKGPLTKVMGQIPHNPHFFFCIISE